MSVSNFHAKSVQILGHLKSESGERIHTLKTIDLFKNEGIRECRAIDLFDLFGEMYAPLAQLNYDLARSGFPLVEKMSLPAASKICKKLNNAPGDLFLVLSRSWSVAALFATGIQRNRRIAVKLQVHHEDERVITPLYEPAHLIVTESLLANQRGIHYGIPASKMLYLPHSYSEAYDVMKVDGRAQIERIAAQLGKKIGKTTVLVGISSRLECGKNCEFGIETIRQLVLKGHDVMLYIKGSLSQENFYPEYNKVLQEMLNSYQSEPWLIWDKSETPYPEILSLYKACDLFLQLSGAEAGSQTIVELLGLGRPVIVLEASTNPWLFKGGAVFVRPLPERKNALVPFYIPDMDHLKEKVMEFVSDEKARKEFGRRAEAFAQQRFHPSRAQERLSSLFDSDASKLEEIYKMDLEEHGI